ncbi:MAG: hypothetical protein Ct9H300mP1_22510 [Planctomycetaceae bacterium]|nr:MAG: hypothetical protein Ct9H300mP1_22510 [Planctomycetaceae bacterium]
MLASNDWHAGDWIVANQGAEEFEKPTVCWRSRPWKARKGIGPSFAGFDSIRASPPARNTWSPSADTTPQPGVIRSENVEAFREAFAAHVAEHHKVTDSDLELRVDAEVRLQDLTRKAINSLDTLSPFGQGNPRPRFSATGVELAEAPQTMGEGDLTSGWH